MRANNILTLAVLMATLVTSISVEAQTSITWAPNIHAAKLMAAKQNQLVLLHFWSPTCVPCMRLEQTVFIDPQVAQSLHRDYVMVKVNADQSPATAQSYGVDRLPTDVVCDSAGKILHRRVSPQDPHEFVSQLQQLAVAHRPAAQANQFAGAIGQPPATGGSQFSPVSQQQHVQPQNSAGQNSTGQAHYVNNLHQPQPAQTAAVGSRYTQQIQPPAQAQGNWNSAVPGIGAPPPGQAPINQQPINQQPAWQQNNYGPAAGVGPAVAAGAVGAVNSGPGPGISPWNAAPPAGQAPGTTPVGLQQSAYGQPGPSAPTAPTIPPGNPAIGLEGYCPFLLSEETRWQLGDAQFGAIHRGRTYLFTSQAHQQKFLANPDLYSPMLSSHDPVLYVDRGQMVGGQRKHGVFFRKHVYLFYSEETLQAFWKAPDRYAAATRQAMQQVAQNPPR